MIELGWAATIQAVLMAISTIIIRWGSKKDATGVKNSTAAQTTSDEILKRVKVLEDQVTSIKEVIAPPGEIDHRGPSQK